MRPNQLFFRRTQVGGRGVLWIFSAAAAWACFRFALDLAQSRPRAFGIESAISLFAATVLLLPPVWALLSKARRRFVARGLQKTGVARICRFMIGAGLLWGVAFPLGLVAEIQFASDLSWPNPVDWGWLYLVYLTKTVSAVQLARTGLAGLREVSSNRDPGPGHAA